MYFSQFSAAFAETARILLPVNFLTPNLKFPWDSNTNFGGASARFIRVLSEKRLL